MKLSVKRQKPTKEQRDAADPAQSVWVAASAGSGKTQVLIDRVIRLLLEGADPQSILCLTFTKAAAAEMSTRLFDRLAAWIALEDDVLLAALDDLGVDQATEKMSLARRLFAKALETPGGLKIQTIHAFCERLLQLFPVEAGLAPGFRVMDDNESRNLRQQAFQAALLDSDPEIRRGWDFLEDAGILSFEKLESTGAAVLSGNRDSRSNLTDPLAFRQLAENIARSLGPTAADDPAQLEAQLTIINKAAYEKAAAIIASRDAKAAPFAAQLSALANSPAVEKLFEIFLTKEGTPRKKLLLVGISRAEPKLATWLDGERDRVHLAFQHLGLAKIYAATLTVHAAMAGVLSRIDAMKRQQGLYDFNDLISRTALLLQSSEQARWVLYKLDASLQHILVDEAQDTSPAQWKIIQALSDEFFAGLGRDYVVNRTVFVVGDRKQSIYSFQGADTAAFEMARQRFSGQLGNNQKTLQEIGLTISYRSTPDVLQAVDTAFAKGRLPRTGYGKQGADERDHQASRQSEIGVFELWPLVKKPEEEEPDYWKAPVDLPPQDHPRRILARIIADRIGEWIGKRKLVSQNRAVQSGDILILLQRRNLMFRALIGELRRRNISVAGADRLKLHESLIIHDFLALGQFIRMPDDDHNLACLLKSPLVPKALDEDELFNLCHDRGDVTLWQRLAADHTQTANFERLQLWRDFAMERGPHGFFALVYQHSKRQILLRLGPEAEDATEAFLDLALDHEQQEGPSLIGFLDGFAAGTTEIKRELEQAGGAVRIMTVHGSKGLEAPIVILADAADVDDNTRMGRLVAVPEGEAAAEAVVFVPDLKPEPDIIGIWKTAATQKRLEERMRLLYVGMTRARDELYVCGSSNAKLKDGLQPGAKEDSWWHQIADAITEATEIKNLRSIAQPDGDVIYRLGADPVSIPETIAESIMPLQLPEWAKALPPRRAPIQKPVAAAVSQVFDLAAARHGIAIHRWLEKIGDLPKVRQRQLGLQRAAKLGIDDATAEKLLALFDQSGLDVFFGPDSQAEVSIHSRSADAGGISMGRIDRLVIEPDSILLLDFKSGHQPAGKLPPDHPYLQQMQHYGNALTDAYPGRKLKAALLWTQNAELQWLDLQGFNQL